ncbi:hypothetical protein Ahy_B03g066655 isoform C [Arachis hypogaea]|uniref:MULE transposase domain-containing protein n=1 Tax=Arachis hypogaea TaxID=3818 RepID=A0A445A4K9_ARAHY|nr:hypothetical protein Ahy_B03g066655 isoform C [Arachis hypogaea]
MMVKFDITINIKVLRGSVENHFGYKASYKKVWLAKQRVIARIYGDWEESDNELPRWLFTMQMYLPGKIYFKPWPGSADTVMFHRVFWTFSPCVEAFKHYKPLLSIDGTHLYGKYGGTLLMAIAQDGNANILPIAFAVVEGETKEAWASFLSYLREHVTPQPGILVISDRHKSIDGTLNTEGSLWKPPHAFQAFCTRHIASNFMIHFKNKDLKKVLINAAYLKSQHELAYYFGRLEEMPRSQWAQYADEGRQFDHTSPNPSSPPYNRPVIQLGTIIVKSIMSWVSNMGW